MEVKANPVQRRSACAMAGAILGLASPIWLIVEEYSAYGHRPADQGWGSLWAIIYVFLGLAGAMLGACIGFACSLLRKVPFSLLLAIVAGFTQVPILIFIWWAS